MQERCGGMVLGIIFERPIQGLPECRRFFVQSLFVWKWGVTVDDRHPA